MIRYRWLLSISLNCSEKLRPERTSLLLNLRHLLASHPLEEFLLERKILSYLLYALSVAHNGRNAIVHWSTQCLSPGK